MLKVSPHLSLSEQLRLVRKRQGKTQMQISHLAGIDVCTLRSLEQGKGSLRCLWSVLPVLGVTIEGRNLPAGNSLGKRLAVLRQRRGISQRAFASLLGVSPPTLVALENTGRGRVEVLCNVCFSLGAGVYLAPIGQGKPFYTHAGNSSGQNLWTTPAWLIERLVEAFGRFDLDPCAATKFPVTKPRIAFTPEDDGLALPWFGRVFVNPPYGRELPLWIRKIIQEVQAGRITLAVALIPARTDTRWWHEAITAGATAVFFKGRLKFGNSEQSAPFPSALLVWGASVEGLMALRRVFPDALL